MNEKRQQAITVTVFIGVLLFLLVTLLVIPGRATSTLENRDLAQKPAFPAHLTGMKKYVRAWDAYLLDQVPYRDQWLKTYYFTQLRVFGKDQQNHVIVSKDGYLLQTPHATPTRNAFDKALAESVGQITKLDGAVTAYGGHLLYAYMPTKASFFIAGFPDYLAPHVAEQPEQELMAALDRAGMAPLNLRPILDAQRDRQIFYQTDHHWTFEGAFLGYEAIMQRFGLSPLERTDLEYTELPNPFVGSENKLVGMAMSSRDRLAIGIPKDAVPYTLTIDSKIMENGDRYYRLPVDVSTPASYSDLYPYVNRAEVVIDTDREALPDLLIIGDSFKAPIECLLYSAFDETRHVDLRRYKAMSVIDYVAKYQPDYVLDLVTGLSFIEQPWNVYDKPSVGGTTQPGGD